MRRAKALFFSREIYKLLYEKHRTNGGSSRSNPGRVWVRIPLFLFRFKERRKENGRIEDQKGR